VTSFKGVHVLAADDSAVNREVLIETLARLDVQVTSVNDGQAAIDAFRARSFDLIFMDGSMPNVDGFAAARAIREIEAATGQARVPIIALTAHVLGEQASRWRDAGMCDHVSKPFALKTIQSCLERWLGPRRGAATDHEVAAPASDAVSGAKSALIDDSVLAQIAEMQAPGDDLVRRILGLYVEHAPKALERLAALVEGGSAGAAADAAHALKSLSRNVGAALVGDLCGEVEAAAREGVPLTPSGLDAIAGALADTLLHIKDLRNAQPVPESELRLLA
jgi:two-component system sensor histidine kinase BarA